MWEIAQGKRNYRENLCHLMSFALDVVFETHMGRYSLCKTLSGQSSSAESCNLKLFFIIIIFNGKLLASELFLIQTRDDKLQDQKSP